MYFSIYISKKKLKKVLNINSNFIDNVGVKNLYYPIIFDDLSNKIQKTLGLWNFSISLLSFKRGIHMSRFLKILDIITNKPISIKSFYYIYKLIVLNLESNDLFYQVSFVYFLRKITPISNNKCLVDYKITLSLKKDNIFINYIIKITVPVISLCPCSKDISFFNAHNQRTYVNLFIKINNKLNIIKIIKIIEFEASSGIWSILKREDEKYVTEFIYKNPKFLEDYIRNITIKIKKIKFIISYIIKIENLESIHNHNAYSILKKYK